MNEDVNVYLPKQSADIEHLCDICLEKENIVCWSPELRVMIVDYSFRLKRVIVNIKLKFLLHFNWQRKAPVFGPAARFITHKQKTIYFLNKFIDKGSFACCACFSTNSGAEFECQTHWMLRAYERLIEINTLEWFQTGLLYKTKIVFLFKTRLFHFWFHSSWETNKQKKLIMLLLRGKKHFFR